MNNGVFLPIEITSREYISKILLATQFLYKDMPVIIGHKTPVIKLALKSKEPGVFFYKSAKGNSSFFDKIKDKGFLIVAQDEEAGVIFNKYEDFYKNRPSLSTINELDLFFCWGNDEYDFLSKKCGSKIVKKSGALRPSFWGDLGRKFYENEIKDIKSKYEDFVLIVSNLGTFNEYLTKKQAIKHESQYEGFDISEYMNRYNAEEKIFNQYIEIAKEITKKTSKKVVIRPHPSEDILGWKKAIGCSPNIFIENEGELITWIFSSICIIQNNCTSSIEAVCANIPVITYADEESDFTILSKGKDNIPNLLSKKIINKDNLINLIEKIENSWNIKDEKINRNSLLSQKLINYGSFESSSNIVEEIVNIVGSSNMCGNENLGRDSILYDIYELYRTSNFRIKTPSSIMDINKRKKLDTHMVESDIKKIMKIMNKRKKFEIKRISLNTFYLKPLKDNNEKK
jgi:surface carbohydrate biosynthesis protein